MKWFNYFIGILVALFISVWTFNHVNAWVGIGIAFVLFYAILYKIVNYVKGSDNEEV